MPKLARIRYISIGYPNARLGDVTLNFRGTDNRATDSTLWLRNGGGKSSLLNLLFACVRPDRREFLGGKADSKRRRLEDYILANDRSVVACEWELDGDRPDALGATERLLAGVFYEWRGGRAADGSRLQRLFFSFRVSDEDPRTSLEGLPVYVQREGKAAGRRNMVGFQQELSTLRERLPHLSVAWTKVNKEWQERLGDSGIDTELFAYQVHMNRREGGADEMFRFDEHEQFVDFLLEMVLDPSLGDSVRKNIEAYRHELKERKNRYLPERELLDGVLQRITPLAEISHKRGLLFSSAAVTRSRLDSLKCYLKDRIDQLQQEAESRSDDLDRESAAMKEAEDKALAFRKEAAGLARHAASLRLSRATTALEESRRKFEEATRRQRIWTAAIPLRDSLRFMRSAESYRKRLRERQAEHAPLLQQLQQAALELASVLNHRRQTFTEEQVALRLVAKQKREQAVEFRRQAGECQAGAATARATADHAEERLQATAREAECLRQRGYLEDGETGARALVRTEQEAQGLEEEQEDLTKRLEGAESEEEDIGDARLKAQDEASRSEEREKALRERLDEALAARRELEDQPVLRQCLETEEADIECLTEGSLTTIEKRISNLVDRIVDTRIEQGEDERAVSHLESHGLLPPTRDAQRILDVLRQRLPVVWSGWTYIEANTPATEGARRAAVERSPQFALGVIVRDEDLDAARRIANESALPLDTPVVVASQSALLSPEEGRGFVLGPSSDAYFDFEAGRKELACRRSRLDEFEGRLAVLGGQRTEAEDLLSRLRDFRQRFPRGWFADQELRIQQERGALEKWRHRIRSLSQELKSTVEEKSRLTGMITETAQKIRDKISARERLREFIDRHESMEARDRQTYTDACELAKRKQEEKERLERDAAAEETAAQAASEQAAKAGEERSTTEFELERLEYVEGDSPEPKSGAVDPLRDDYHRLKAMYEEQVGTEGLLQLARREEEQAAEYRKKFNALLQGGISASEVEQALGEIADPSRAEQLQSEATEAFASARGSAGRNEQLKESMAEKLAEAEERCKDLGGVEEGLLGALQESPEEADARGAMAGREAERLDAQAKKHQKEAEVAETAWADAERGAEALEADAQRLESIAGAYAEFLGRVPVESVPSQEIMRPTEDCRVRGLLAEIDRELRESRDDLSRLDSERHATIRRTRAWVDNPQFESLRSRITVRIRQVDEEELEGSSAQYVDELTLRIRMIDEQLAKMNEHRELLVKQVLAVAEEGLDLLRSASRQSQLPDHVPGLGGAHFLRISIRPPDEPEARLERLRELVDELVEEGSFPGGLALVQQAVRRLARPIRVRVLNPDPDLERQSVDIPDMGKFSGGEQLTCAILLYCTLAQLRTRQSGRFRRPTSVLLLDNPIGRASRVRFLQLQREVARAMGIQLIYTTAVNDEEALHTLPNVIRLRNERFDRASGNRMVEIQGDGQIEAARIARAETEGEAEATAKATSHNERSAKD